MRRGWCAMPWWAANAAQAKALWHMRESMSPAQKPEGGSIKHDLSVPVAAIPGFHGGGRCGGAPGHSRRADLRLRPIWATATSTTTSSSPSAPTPRPSSPAGARSTPSSTPSRLSSAARSRRARHRPVKRDELAELRSGIEITLMRRIKDAFDPRHHEPGKLLAQRL